MMSKKDPAAAASIGARRALQPVTGGEAFVGVDATVLDFWRWAVSDLRMNTARTMLADFFVAVAVDNTGRERVEWDNYDVVSRDEIKIEVKASGYRQSWGQKRKSDPKFGWFLAKEFDWDAGKYVGDPKVRADVFVFALQTSWEYDDYDVLDVGQWEFYVMPAQTTRDCDRKELGMSFVRQHGQYRGKPVRWGDLREVIHETARHAGVIE